MSNKEIDIHMSNLDEETGKILTEDAPDESKQNSKKKYPSKTITIQYDDDGNETNTSESPDSEW